MNKRWHFGSTGFHSSLSFFPGEFGSQRLAGDLSLRRWSGRDQGSCHQCGTGDDGERRQGLPQTGEGEPDGRMEVLHFLWVSGVPLVGWGEVGNNRKGGIVHIPVIAKGMNKECRVQKGGSINRYTSKSTLKPGATSNCFDASSSVSEKWANSLCTK